MTEQPDATPDLTPDMTQNDDYHGYSVDAEDQPEGSESSSADDRGLVDPLEEGYSPPEKWSVAEGYGNTPLEEELGETLDQRLAQEIPEPDPYAEAGVLREDVGGEVGDARAGRLVAEDQGLGEDTEKDLVADDVGIDGAGASAEEAAVHVIDDGGDPADDLAGYDLEDPEADALTEVGLDVEIDEELEELED